MDVEFEELSYTVHPRFWFAGNKKQILKSVSGRFQAGHLSAILGPSGAGKSSLLNAVSGFRSSGVTAKSLKVNGEQRNEKLFRKLSCYITQEEILQPMLTLQEVMMFAADLKLPSKTTRKQKSQLIHEILTMLGLKECCVTRTERLSGGQKKRLSIALELINNPPVIFLDEPTSGLDNVSTSYTLKLLRRLAHQGRTVVCTIHQPSASLFQLFDNVFVLSRGECVYQGATDELVPFLASVGIPCPKYYNPADFIIEVTDGDHEHNIELLSSAINNGKLARFKSGIIKIPCPPNENTLNNIKNDFERITFADLDPLTSFRDEQNNLSMSVLEKKVMNKQSSSSDSSLCADFCIEFPTSSWSQYCTLWKRMTLQIYRNKMGLNIQFYHHLLCSIAVGVVFFDKAKDGSNYFNHLKFCLGFVVFYTFTYCMIPVISYPYEVKLLRREYFNRWYSLRPYFLAVQLCRIPTMVVFNVVFSSILYVTSGLPMESYRFFLFTVIGILISTAAEGMGLFIGAVFNVTNGSAVAPLTLAPFLGLATYGFDFAKEIPWYMNALMNTSFLRNGVVGIVIVIFGMGRKSLDCDRVYCHFKNPSTLLNYLDLENTTAWVQVFYLVSITLIFRISMYIALRYKLST